MENTNKPTDTRLTKVKDEVNSVWKWISFPFKVIWLHVRIGNWLRKHWRSAISIGVFAIGLAMMFGASFRLRGAELVAVLVTAGILIAFAYIKMAFDSAVERARQAEESDTLIKEKAELLEERVQLMGELQQERGKRVKVLNIQPILEIGILEAECEVTKFFDRYFDKDDQEILEDAETAPDQEYSIPRKKIKRFLGALTSKFKAKYGIDMQKVQLKRDDRTKTMYVAGAEPSFLGVRDYPQMQWEGSAGLHYSWGNWMIDENSQRLESECREKYRKAMQESLKNGPEQLNWVKEPLKERVKLLLKWMVTPSDYSVELVEKVDGGFTPLFDYIREKGPDQLLLP